MDIITTASPCINFSGFCRSGVVSHDHAPMVRFVGDQASALPCLYSNNSINELTPSGKKSAFILTRTVADLATKYGINHLGFLTLTFSDHITDYKIAQKRYNSLNTNILKKRYIHTVAVMERQKSGRIHYHLIVVMRSDIRSGVDFTQMALGRYSSCGQSLRAEWSFWRSTASRYGFGRTELLPIKSTHEAIAKYVGKYISKHFDSRLIDDKGARLVRYSRGASAGNSYFQFLSEGSSKWRANTKEFAKIVEDRHGCTISDISDFAKVLGSKWAFLNKDFILGLSLTSPTLSLLPNELDQ